MTRTNRQKRIRKERVESRKLQTDCPTPDKQRFAVSEQAYKRGMTAFRSVGPFKVYRCKCGGYHITTSRN